MPTVASCEYENSNVWFLLANELEKLIPNIKINGANRFVLDLAYANFKFFLEFFNTSNNVSSREMKPIENCAKKTDELKELLKFWPGFWVEKWKKRIAISQRIPKISSAKVFKLRKARSFYYFSIDKKKLKKEVIKRLLKKREYCMPQQIADELIIREIADSLSGKKFSVDENLLCILHGVFNRIEKLQNETKPLIYLKLTKKS